MSTQPEHAVIVSMSLGGEGFGDKAVRDRVLALEREIEAVLDGGDVGELDGNTFGAGEAILFLYGRDADRLFTAIEPSLRKGVLRPAHAVLRYGDAGDPTAHERRIDL